MSIEKRKKRRERLWKANNGKCYWCGIITIMPKKKNKKIIHLPNMATLDHLNNKLYKEKRLQPNTTNEERTVLSCWNCNQIRGIIDEKVVSNLYIIYEEK